MEKFRDLWVRVALVVSLLVPVYFLVAALGTKFGLFPWTVGFVQMTFMWGTRVLLASGVLALIGVLLALFVTPRARIRSALVALLIPLLGVGYGFYIRNAAATVPPIHDISTDLDNPPAFSEDVIRARAAVPQSNDLDLRHKRTGDGQAFTDLQREHYPEIAPVTTTLEATRAFDIALALARDQGWTIGATNADTGAIEATASSFWFGFTDDIAIRVRAEGAGARIDMRSVSRVGRSDLGANARRMARYLEELRAQLAAAGG